MAPPLTVPPLLPQGAFTAAFRSLFEMHCQCSLEVRCCGKPFQVQYTLAEQMLNAAWDRGRDRGKDRGTDRGKGGAEGDAAADNASPPLPPLLPPPWQFYGIGDNPLSDIRGANGANRIGSRWSSVLVRTGVWGAGGEGGSAANDETDPATLVCDDVVHAIHTLGLQ